MFGVIFLIITFVFGWAMLSRFAPEDIQNHLAKFPLSTILGSLIGTWTVFLINIFVPLATSFTITMYGFLFISFFLYPKKQKEKILPKFSFIDITVLIACVMISLLLINQSLHFTPTGILDIGSNCWGDFDIHLPLIRSFAWGSNIPPALPFFPNANAAYHFMFDYWSAILVFGGLPLSYGFNIASAISFSTLLFLLYTFLTRLFGQRKIIGILGIVFFLFNSTLTFIEGYSKLQPKNVFDFLMKITQNTNYLSAGPFTSDHVSIMWNMNVYLNQRHFVFSLAVGLAILLLVLSYLKHSFKTRDVIFLGILIGLLPFCNIHVFLCVLTVMGIIGIFSVQKHGKILYILPIAILVAIPQILWLSHDVHNTVQWNPGFLAPRPLTIIGIVTYWFYNLGISLLTIPLGFVIANKEQKKWFLAFFAVFIIGNLIQFNSDMFNNHKLFNFWILFTNGYTAFLIFFLFQKKHWWKWAIIPTLLFLLTFSGIIDMFVVKNEHFYTINDYGKDSFITWVTGYTPQNAVFLIPTDSMYNPIRMAGRKTYVPSPRYADSYGYDVSARNTLIQELYAAEDPSQTTALLHLNNIGFIELPKDNQSTMIINTSFYNQFPVVFSNNDFSIMRLQ